MMIDISRRYFFLGLAWLCVGLGLIGVVVPGLPTTPFLLVAVWAFSKSSERFRLWLINHPRLGPPICAWQDHGVIARHARILALVMMGLSIVVIVFFTDFHWLAQSSIVLVILGAACFVATRPGAPP